MLKPWQNEKLLATISAALRLKNSYNEVDKLKLEKKQLVQDINQPFKEMLGEKVLPLKMCLPSLIKWLKPMPMC